MGFSRQEYWSELPFPTPGDLPDPRIELASPVSPALAGGFFTIVQPGKPVFSPYPSNKGRDLGYFILWTPLPDFSCGLSGPSLESIGNWWGSSPEEAGGRGGEKEYASWRTWSCLCKDSGDHDESSVLFTVCLCFFQVENFSSWFRAVRTCAHPWTSSPTEPGCKLYAVEISLSATRSSSLCPGFLIWLSQQKSSTTLMHSI